MFLNQTRGRRRIGQFVHLSAKIYKLTRVSQWERAYDHGGQVVRSVMIGPSTSCFEGLFAICYNLLKIYSFEEFGDGIGCASPVID